MPTAHEALVRDVAMVIEPEWYGGTGALLSNYPGQDKKMQERAEERARSAIATVYAAMREPSEEMQTAGELVTELAHDDSEVAVFIAMIGASPLNPEDRNG